MTSGSTTAFGSRRAAASRGWRPAGLVTGAAILLTGAAMLLAAAACRDAHRGAHLVAAVDHLHPGSQIAVQERVRDGARTVEVTIGTREIASDVARLDEDGRAVARAMRDYAGLASGDTVVVVYRSEGGAALARATRRARLVYPVSQL